MVIEELKSRLECRDGCLIWRASGKVAGSVTKRGYVNVKIDGKMFKAHRLVWALEKGKWPDGMLDHINGERGDNRIENLREVTSSQNCMNRAPIGKYKGVQERPSGRFKARIRKYGKWIGLGMWDTAEEAAIAYNKAAVEHFGEFARLNEI